MIGFMRNPETIWVRHELRMPLSSSFIQYSTIKSNIKFQKKCHCFLHKSTLPDSILCKKHV
ncbi:hypothetical protein SLEP1_g47497 [Rubroshorea leprosula]|uniref:Uncharacterized protein n=1 Tax=Rubroshorea leprosula TaxID=152421 RepID=A0AAV5LRL8_9ROSI|nr:hypothetical protein SLEP1_g47497 [Rubroshorea leprosula]